MEKNCDTSVADPRSRIRRLFDFTGSQKVVEESMFPIPEAGGAYM
jgi:hypothetical protein